MAIDVSTLNAMLDPFRGMYKDLRAKNLSGPDVDECAALLQQMEQMAASATDLMALSVGLGNSGLYQKFSDAYTRVMMAAASPKAGSMPTDEEMLQNTLRAYEEAIATLRATGDEKAQKTIAPIEKVIALGRSGITYPVFLRRMEEEGLTDAMEGSVVAREALAQDIAWAQERRNPIEAERDEKILALYDEMAQAAPFGVPDSFRFNLRRQRIEWEYEPALIKRSILEWRWDKLMTHLIDWLDAHTSYAPFDERWSRDDRAQTMRYIKMDKECQPGVFRARERIVKESYGFDFPELDKQEFVANNMALGIVGWTEARLQLARDTYPYCVPGAVAPPELVQRSEQLRAAHADMGGGKATVGPR